jgi:hypothetical protein
MIIFRIDDEKIASLLKGRRWVLFEAIEKPDHSFEVEIQQNSKTFEELELFAESLGLEERLLCLNFVPDLNALEQSGKLLPVENFG